MIGYYVHHQGRGHLHRAEALAAALAEPVTGLSSLPRPPAWRGPWLDLPYDDQDPDVRDITANDQLHWAPLGDSGLRSRATAVSTWINDAHPRLVIVDVSVEIAVLARLHGVPVVSVVLPGRRTDPAHLLGFRAATQLVAMWPPHVRGMSPGLPADVHQRICCLGAVSRLPVVSEPPRRRQPERRRVVLLQGLGGVPLTRHSPRELQQAAPGWDWTVLGGEANWTEDLGPLLRAADVVVTQAGQGSIADIAACQRPAVVIPAARPFDEQVTTAAVLAGEEWPTVVLHEFPESGWSQLLDQTATLDGARWQGWCDGLAVRRFADLVADGVSPVEQRSA